MRKLFVVSTVLSLVGLLLIPGAIAQTGTTPERSGEPTSARPSGMTPSSPVAEKASPKPSTTLGTTKELYTSDLIGATVKNPQGESLGSIKELVLDPQNAKIKNAVVSMGGLLGIGTKSVAIPWNEVTLQSDGKAVVVAMGREELQNAPDWKKPAEETRMPGREPATSPTAPRQGALGR
ncbi:MAG TPA: PRC-barrel domain-containing protein [Candidatus Tectomicrobia bacterium]|nr:PRC-barrel domain-containing protein [Candidatus Tectomicrobia bacterium]